MVDADPRRRAAEALLDWWALTGVDLGDARALMRAAPAASVTQTRPAAPRVATPTAPAAGLVAVEDARKAAASARTLAELHTVLNAFEGCALKKTARTTVFADGDETAEIMLIGEAPDKDEDEIGKPFAGRSGALLDRMFGAIGLSRSKTLFIANTIFWRPPGNRPPTQGEIAVCLPFIRRAIELKQPKMIVTIGPLPAQTILGRDTGLARLRGKRIQYKDGDSPPINAMAMLHPAYLLKRPQDKRTAWADLLMLESWLQELGVKREPRL